jgi:hypothetical protein
MEAVEAAEPRGRRAHLIAGRRRQRRLVAVALAVAGIVVLVLGLNSQPGSFVGGSSGTSTGSVRDGGVVNGRTGRPAVTGPGGVGQNPARTGLPAEPAPGGKVRTGTKEQGCFDSVREYLDAWDRTGVEPDPCFTSQPASNQPQPNDVNRTYNGQPF